MKFPAEMLPSCFLGTCSYFRWCKKIFSPSSRNKTEKCGQKTLTVDPSINQEKVWGPWHFRVQLTTWNVSKPHQLSSMDRPSVISILWHFRHVKIWESSSNGKKTIKIHWLFGLKKPFISFIHWLFGLLCRQFTEKELPGSDIYKCLFCSTKILPVHDNEQTLGLLSQSGWNTDSSNMSHGNIFRKLDPRQKLLNGVWVFFPHALHHP